MTIVNCLTCNKEFNKIPAKIRDRPRHFCSTKCMGIGNITKVDVVCTNCSKPFKKTPSQCKKSPNHFCNNSCAATYNNKHKTHGTRISKLELYLQEQLVKKYQYELHFNRKDAINSELDIYIPELKLAFELNGIFHYEPIYGEDKLSKIQNNDNRKFQACLEKNIELCVIDTSWINYNTLERMNKILEIIERVITMKESNI